MELAKKQECIFYNVYFVRRKSFSHLCFTSVYSVLNIFQNIYTFTCQKMLLHILLLLVFKIFESLQCILNLDDRCSQNASTYRRTVTSTGIKPTPFDILPPKQLDYKCMLLYPPHQNQWDCSASTLKIILTVKLSHRCMANMGSIISGCSWNFQSKWKLNSIHL